MSRKFLYAWVIAGALTMMSCADAPRTLLSPTGSNPVTAFANADGSTLKVGAPGGLSPSGGAVVNSLRPTLSFSASAARFQATALTYELEIQNALGAAVYQRDNLAAGSHEVQQDLTYEDNYWFRVRGRIGPDVGPWSDFAQFRTPDRPAPPGPTLPFVIPAECGPFGPVNRFPCAAAIAAQSAEWLGCTRGSGTACHRFTRQVAYALSLSDPNWKMIMAAPGGNACNCFGCGPSDGSMFREDTVVYGGNTVFDVIVGAGGPTPGLNWSLVPGPRSGDIPNDAPLCIP